ncbi:hypothetical protein HYALB_00001520 [Hymenoscyphus albidus]|uniref:Ecp2 effector protein domain-containing protein n=1 Tax=Hymenoscyphus albidus TaxID=595503 RepID=A0A9N9PPZ7_9HELO|nr:hypothetical protein HYALB_00001520 [Hymenoscyphus albidus]
MLCSTTTAQIFAFLALTASTLAVPLTSNDGLVTDYKVWAAEKGVITTREEGLQKRAGGLYACNAPNFSNSEGCVLLHPVIGQCSSFPNGFIDRVSSIGPDSDLICTLFDNSSCQRNQPQLDNVVSPGFQRLHDIGYPGGTWEDRLASYICFRN